MEPHKPVLLTEVTNVLNPKRGEQFVDLTAGYGGHSAVLLHEVGADGYGYLFDRDPEAIGYLRSKFANYQNLTIKRANFGEDETYTLLPKVDMILLDLGVSSAQLDTAERGFSFRSDAPLDMRMDQNQQLDAAAIINTFDERQLADILWSNADERRGRAIARAIVNARKVRAITTTRQLAEIVAKVVPRRGRINPATKTFQALRIAVNDELAELKKALPLAAAKLKQGGRMAAISFHSGEDRIVKHYLTEITRDQLNDFGQIKTPAGFQKVTTKAIQADPSDLNPRARSAKLRAAVKN